MKFLHYSFQFHLFLTSIPYIPQFPHTSCIPNKVLNSIHQWAYQRSAAPKRQGAKAPKCRSAKTPKRQGAEAPRRRSAKVPKRRSRSAEAPEQLNKCLSSNRKNIRTEKASGFFLPQFIYRLKKKFFAPLLFFIFLKSTEMFLD